MKNNYKRFVHYYISLAERRPHLLLMAFFVLAAASLFVAATQIRIDTDLAALLPEDTESVRALEMSETRIGAIDYFTIAIESKAGNTQAIANLQDQLKERIESEWQDAAWVQIDRDTSFFREHALYYLDRKDLLELKYLLEDEVLCASADAMPGLVNLMDDEDMADEKSLDTWYSEDIPRRMGLPSQVCRSFNEFFDEADAAEDATGVDRLDSGYSDRLISAEGDVGVVLVKLSKPSTDIDYAKMALKRSQGLIASLNPRQIDPGLKVEIVGAYRKFMEVEAIGRDGKTATIISVILVLALLCLFFRSLRTIIVVFLPLIVAASLTMGIVGLTYARLTVLTVFILALLVGMGIDYGIHLFGRIKQELRLGYSLPESMEISLFETGQALLAAAATTVASMLVLLFGHFEGFREFGVVASFGLIACAASAILIIPPLVFSLQSIKLMSKKCDGEQDTFPPNDRLFGMNLRRLAIGSFVFTMAVVALLSVYAPDTQFEYDIRNIMSPATETPIDFMRAIGKDSGTAPAIVLGENIEQMRAVHAYLLDKMVVEKDQALKSFVTYHTFVPAMEDQLKRQKVIRQIGRILKKKALQDLGGDKGKLVRELAQMTEAEPFDHENLPEWAKRIFTESNGDNGSIGHIYAKFDEWNVYSGQDFQDRYSHLNFDGKWLPIACSRFILSDVVRMVKSDGLRLLLIVSLVLIVILFLFTRKVISTLILFGVMAVGGLWCAGLMGLLDIRISLYNIIVIPVILGVGIDGAIHLYHKYQADESLGISNVLRTTGFTVSASSLTTMAGFMGLLFVDHKGLQTIGQLGTIGIITSWLAVMLLLPFLLPLTVEKESSLYHSRSIEKART